MIDADKGDVHLPNGFVITSALTLEAFQQSGFCQSAIVHRPTGLQEQRWFELDAGMLDLRSAFVSLVFCGQEIASVDLQLIATCYFGDTLKDYFATELGTKAFSDALLRHDLGEANFFSRTNCDEPGLDKAPNYLLSWGRVISDFDYGAGNAYIEIRYGERKREDERRQQVNNEY